MAMKVVIVGGGPAGLITALNLIQVGIYPTVLEKQAAIRSTACGEAIDVPSLGEIPFDSGPYLLQQVKGARVVYANSVWGYLRQSCVTLDRTRWLQGMARQIEADGGQVRVQAKVVAVNRDSVELKDGQCLAYDVLIGADGAGSVIARHMGIKHRLVVGSQYKIAADTSDMEYLDFYLDQEYLPGYAWVFPRDGIINVGVEGNFSRLDTFLGRLGWHDRQIIAREAGPIPISGIQQLVSPKIALIGDAAAMPNPLTGGGLTPVVYAAQMLARNIDNLDGYQREVRQHPMAAPVLTRTKEMLLNLSDRDIRYLANFVTDHQRGGRKLPFFARLVKYPGLLLRLNLLQRVYRSIKISRIYGW